MSDLFTVVQELEHEGAAIDRLLARIPEDKLSWRPHPKSMTLGQLALHIATIPGSFAQVLSQSDVEASVILDHPMCGDLNAIRNSLPATVEAARRFLTAASSQELESPWSVLSGGKAVLTVPKAVALRLLMLNHWYHHRGQLTVYLRLLDVPLPVVYAASADEAAF